MKQTYNRLAAGDRLRMKRNLLGFTQDEVAEKIDRAPKYYADIERGNCGMSIETLLALSKILDMSLDYIIYGITDNSSPLQTHTDETTAIIETLNSLPPRQHQYALRLLKVFLSACDVLPENNSPKD